MKKKAKKSRALARVPAGAPRFNKQQETALRQFLSSGFFPQISGLPGYDAPRTPLKASEGDLRRDTPTAFVDPSRLFASGLFAPYNPSVLVTRKGLDIFDQMKLDEQVKMALGFKKLAALAPGWEIESPEGQDEKWEVTKFVKDVFTAIPEGFSAALEKIMRGMEYGYSVNEKIYAEGTGLFEGKLVLKKLNECKPHYFDFELDQFGEVLSLIQRLVIGQPPSNGGNPSEPRFPPDKFVVYTYDKEFENPYGKSDLEAAYRAWWVKDNAYKWLAIMLERYGLPPLFLFYDPNAYVGNQVDELKKVVKGIQNATMGILPRGGKDALEFYTATVSAASKEIFLSALGRFDADIAKALLQPSHLGATTETKDQGSGGSMARSNVHFKMFMFVIKELQNDVATRAINSQIIPQLCDLNFAGLKAYPKFRFLDVDDEAEIELFRLWSELVTGKVVGRTEDDEKHIRSSLGFPANDAITLEPLPSDATLDAERERLAAGGKPGDKTNGKAVPKEKQTAEMQEFAEQHEGEWFMINGHPVCLRVQEEAES